ncbi:MAG: DUF4198 domain-containing protein, partial [Planctomycetota bacterium]
MNRGFATGLMAMAAWCPLARPAQAHFQVLIPSRDVVSPGDPRTIELEIVFTHPMDNGPAMEMGPPRQFGMLVDGRKHDLLDALTPTKVDDKRAYAASVRLSRPGDHVFYIEPAPYWEPAERKMIVHYTKVVVDFMGAQTGWDRAVGFPVEIEPLVRPYALWSGNTFRGIVRHNGQPVPFAEIEVEYYNEDGRVRVPNDAFVTQVVKADAAGTFSYTMP